MNAGDLRQLLTVQVKTETQDGKGALRETWADLYTGIPCKIEPTGSREFPDNLKRNAEAQARFRIRYRTGLDPSQHRFKTIDDFSTDPQVTKIWDIFPPYDPDGMRHELVVEAHSVFGDDGIDVPPDSGDTGDLDGFIDGGTAPSFGGLP